MKGGKHVKILSILLFCFSMGAVYGKRITIILLIFWSIVILKKN